MKKSLEQQVADLKHQNHLLKQKIEILELEVEIEKRKAQRIQVQRSPWTSPSVTWDLGPVTSGVVDILHTGSVKDFTDQITKIYKRMGGQHGPGSPTVS